MRDKLFKIGLYTVNYVLENFESVHILGMYKYTLFEILKALSRDGNDFVFGWYENNDNISKIPKKSR